MAETLRVHQLPRRRRPAVTSLVLTFILAPGIIDRLKRMKLHQIVREGTPDSHQGKNKTPTMGGLIILGATLFITILWSRLDNRYVPARDAVDAVDGRDRILGRLPLKLKQKQQGLKNTGLVERHKLIGQVALGLALGWFIWKHPLSSLPGRVDHAAVLQVHPDRPAHRGPRLAVRAVRDVRDDGHQQRGQRDRRPRWSGGGSHRDRRADVRVLRLRGGARRREHLSPHLLSARIGELTVFCAGDNGACIGFLWYNTHPAEVFMGDTGSLALGGALASVAILLKSEFLLVLVGAVFVAEMMSVILQRFVFKYRKRRYGIEYAREHRVFRRAPLHHHFEVKGWDEAQVVVRFWIIGVLFAFIALSTLQIR